ncbi:TetR/AcrR family transcriptional regulator [Amorphus sp. MBR-141]
MPRVRALDYDDKLEAVCDAAARLFAASGYPTAKMAEIAAACGVSKSMLYHYFPTKDDLLFHMIQEHLLQVIEDLEQTAVAGEARPEERLVAFIQTFVRRSAGARQRNLVAMNDAKFLAPAHRSEIRVLERRIIDLIARHLRNLNPQCSDKLLKIFTFFLLGILNWSDGWYDPEGEINPDELATYISELYLRGFSQIVLTRPDTTTLLCDDPSS